jgi:hypothetical protein
MVRRKSSLAVKMFCGLRLYQRISEVSSCIPEPDDNPIWTSGDVVKINDTLLVRSCFGDISVYDISDFPDSIRRIAYYSSCTVIISN